MHGAILVVPANVASLPRVCVRCGGEAHGEPVKRPFRWHDPWLYVLLFAGCLVYAIVATIVVKRHRLELSLCQTHRSERMVRMLLGYLGGTIAMIGICVVGAFVSRYEPAVILGFGLVAMLVFVVGLYIAGRAENVLVVKRIDAHESHFEGASPSVVQAGIASVFA